MTCWLSHTITVLSPSLSVPYSGKQEEGECLFPRVTGRITHANTGKLVQHLINHKFRLMLNYDDQLVIIYGT